MAVRWTLGWLFVGLGVVGALASAGAWLYGWWYPVESWEGQALTAFRYVQSASGLVCVAASGFVVLLGGLLVRGSDPRDPNPPAAR